MLQPMPAKDFVNLESDVVMESISLYDLSGQTLATFAVNSTSFRFDTQSLTKGMYFLAINTAKGTVNKKLIRS